MKSASAANRHDHVEVDFEMISTESGFKALEPEWNDLWARSSEKRFTQTFAWRWFGWITTGRPRGREPRILVLREDGEPVLIWPMAVRPRYRLWREAIALGPEYTDYHPIVIANTPRRADRLAKAARHLARAGVADVITTPFLQSREAPEATPPSRLRHARIETLPAPRVSWVGFQDWDTYWRARGKSVRANLKRCSRRLAEMGVVTFDRVDEREELETSLNWTLRRKQEWLSRNGLDNDYMRAPEFAKFLLAICKEIRPNGRWAMFALKLNGNIIATEMGALDALRFESFMAAQDPGYAALSPGSLLQTRILQQMFEAGVDYDFRIGAESYKIAWATHNAPVTTISFATGPWGALYLDLRGAKALAKRLKDRARLAIPGEIRQTLKATARAALALRPIFGHRIEARADSAAASASPARLHFDMPTASTAD